MESLIIPTLRQHAPFDEMETEALAFLAAKLKLAYYPRLQMIVGPDSGAADRLYIIKQLAAVDFHELMARSARFQAFCTDHLSILLERAHRALRETLRRRPVCCPQETSTAARLRGVAEPTAVDAFHYIQGLRAKRPGRAGPIFLKRASGRPPRARRRTS